MAKVSVKHAQIDKSQSKMLAVVAVAVAVSIFCLFGTKAMIVKGLYQRRALHARRDTAALLKSNYDSAKTLVSQYQVFADENPNILGGSTDGNGDTDGDNPRIVLDALPSKYDAPALASSVEKILTGRAISINSIDVTDDPTTNSDLPAQQPVAKPITFSFEGTTNFTGAQELLQDFERSIRPFDINTLEVSGTDSSLKLTVTATTYYQPAKSLDLTITKEVK